MTVDASEIRHAAHRGTVRRPPVREQIVTDAAETFLWRCDDYPWERNVWNVHPEYEIHLVRNASGVALVGDHIEPFEPGYLAIVGSGLPHDWVTPTAPGETIPARDIVLQFDPKRVLEASARLPEMAALRPFLEIAMRGLSFHGETRAKGAAMLEAMRAVTGVRRLALFLELLQVLSERSEYKVLSSPDFAPDTDGATMTILEEAILYIRDNVAREIRIGEVSARLGMNDWTFSRFFKKNTGNSFTDYVAMLRIGHACQLLAETAMPITDVCFEVGFSNVSNFNRIFRGQRGMTPSHYRRLSRQRLTRRSAEVGTKAEAGARAGGSREHDT